MMGVFTFTDEYISRVSPTRLFKTLAVDSHTKSIDIIQGDGARTIKQINVIKDSRIISLKNHVDELNKEMLTYKYTMSDLKEKFESIVHEVKFEVTLEGESKSKIRGTCYTEGDVGLKEEDVNADKEKILGTLKAVEAYLLQNPNAHA